MDTSTAATGLRRPATATRLDRAEILFALAAFAALCAAALSFAPRLVEPDDHAYEASIVAITQGHWLTLSTALAASWFSVWGLYSAYTWTANDFVTTLQSARFYVPAIGAIALLGAWLLVRAPRRSSLAATVSVAVVAAMFGLGLWSFGDMRVNQGPQTIPEPAGAQRG